jgi:hypothetical protein
MAEPAPALDIAKLKFNVCLINTGGRLRHTASPDTATGFPQLCDWLSGRGIRCAHARLAAAGTYGQAPALFPHQAGRG